MNFNKNILLYLFLLAFVPAIAQTDSITITTAKWEKKRVSRGVTLKQCWFNNNNLFNSNQNVIILEVKTKGRNKIDIGFDRSKLKRTSDFGKTANALAAINGTFFDIKNGGSVDYLKVNDTVINENRLLENNIRARHQRAGLVIDNGKLKIEKWDGTNNWEKKLQEETVMLSGPLLLSNHTPEFLDSSAFNIARNPRSAIAVLKKNKVAFITIDGRNDNAKGMSIFELARIMKWMHYQDAINLDGGGSTALWVKGESGNGIVNYPCDNKKWDHEGERKVANVVLVRRD